MTCDRRRFLLLLAAGAAGCASGIPVLRFGQDACDFCRMTISEPEFAALAVTAQGRDARFDSIECLAAWVAQQEQSPRGLWVTDFATQSTLVPAAEARYYRGGTRSPMGQGWIAMAPKGGGAAAPEGEGPFAWDDVQRAVADRRTGRSGGAH